MLTMKIKRDDRILGTLIENIWFFYNTPEGDRLVGINVRTSANSMNLVVGFDPDTMNPVEVVTDSNSVFADVRFNVIWKKENSDEE